MSRLRTSLRMLARGFLARGLLAGTIAMTLAGPLQAQTVVPADDAPIIDLGAALGGGLPDAPATDRNPAPASAPALNTAPAAGDSIVIPRQVEILDEAALTLPQYMRSDAVPGAEALLSDDVLLPLQSERATLAGIVRLTGEVQSENFFVDLPLAGAARDLVLAYRIAINVLPEQSELRIRVNGTDLEPVRPTAFEGFEQLVLPSTLLTAGRNEITVSVYHAHRIFCGPDATFAVWTEINTNISGVRLARNDLPVDPVGLRMALSAQVAMSGSLPVHFFDAADQILLDRLAPRLAGLRDGAPVVLNRQPTYGVTDGAVQMARVTVLPGDGPARADIRRAADGALVLVLTIGLDGSMPDLEALLPMPPPVANVPYLAPGTTTTLRDLGFTRVDAYNRYSEQLVTFRLPDDWLILASQKALLRLVYNFTDGLPEGSLMLVKMNDTTVRLLPLDRDGGKVLPTLDIDFPARLLVPGNNALTFVAIIPGDPPELPCPVLTGPLMTIGAQSTMLVPPSPRMRMAGLDRPLVSMRPDQVSTAVGTTEDTDIAGNLMATVAAALRPVDQTSRIDTASLTVTYGAGTGQIDLEDLGINRRDLARLLPTDRSVPVPRTLKKEGDGLPPDEAEGDARQQAQDVPAAGLIARTRAMVLDWTSWLVRLAVPGDGPLDLWLEGRQAEAVLFIPHDAAPEALWLLVSPQSNPGQVAAILAQARLSAVGPKGRLSLLTSEGKWESWHTTRTAPTLHEPLSISNFREIAGNYASWSPLYFCAVLLALTLVSAGVALVYIVTTRGSRKK